METHKCIYERRSVRRYDDSPVEYAKIKQCVADASMAPSGMNRQPWKFSILMEKDKIEKIAALSASQGGWIKTASCLVFVFFDKNSSYNREKDLMAIGAAVQTFMLAAKDNGIGTCWLGGILDRKEEILDIIDFHDQSCEMEAIIAAGYSEGKAKEPVRKPLEKILI